MTHLHSFGAGKLAQALRTQMYMGIHVRPNLILHGFGYVAGNLSVKFDNCFGMTVLAGRFELPQMRRRTGKLAVVERTETPALADLRGEMRVVGVGRPGRGTAESHRHVGMLRLRRNVRANIGPALLDFSADLVFGVAALRHIALDLPCYFELGLGIEPDGGREEAAQGARL